MQLVTNSQQLIEAMGYWPSFHDAHVVAASRMDGDLSVTVHVFEITDEADPQGYLVLEKHYLVTFEFHNVRSSTLPPHYVAGCLSELEFSKCEGGIHTSFWSHVQDDGEVISDKVAITKVVPCSEQGRALT